ncbi:MAG: class I SAM-dependent methyltransferase [Phyllobacteriaceae bacterium]|nr:class I SAM-dependent methyltransferase [Phyllobacteriaceae bacterium]
MNFKTFRDTVELWTGRLENLRERTALRYLRGRGIEIGALHKPLWVPPWAKVSFVDRLSEADLRLQYPELRDLDLVDPDVVDDGEKLGSFADDSQDFIIANHFLEHTEDPIGTIRRHVAVLRRGGTLYLAVPDKHYTFDRDRPVTTYEHLVRDHREGPSWSRLDHFREYVGSVMKIGDPAQREAEVARLDAMNYSIHFHVWTGDALKDFVERAIVEFEIPATLVSIVANPSHGEHICVLRKSR